MTYRLIKVGEAAYDVAQGVRIVARLDQERPRGYWRAELVARLAPEDLPQPFQERKHRFPTFAAAREWLGWPEIIATAPQPARWRRKGVRLDRP